MVALAIRRLGWSAGEFHRQVCGCDVCRGVLEGDISNFREFGRTDTTMGADGRTYSYAAPKTRTLCNSHFIRAFEIERRRVMTRPLDEVCEALRDASETYARHFGEDASHLDVWAEAFSHAL
jgi:hypothetical protein